MKVSLMLIIYPPLLKSKEAMPSKEADMYHNKYAANWQLSRKSKIFAVSSRAKLYHPFNFGATCCLHER